ncbi:MAG: DUF349 domain-containing protein [Bacteroidales bacterium]|nr:DUF349 domain-containing protein [Bacteroidales bacterium]
MAEIDPKDSVLNEQSGNTGNINEPVAGETNETSSENTQSLKPDDELPEISETRQDSIDDEKPVLQAEKAEEQEPPLEKVSEVTEEDNLSANSIEDKSSPAEDIPETLPTDVASKPEAATAPDLDVEIPKAEEPANHPPALSEINLSDMGKTELVDTLRKYISEYPLESIKDHVEAIKSVYYKTHNAEIESIKENFIADGGHPEDFKVEESPIDINMKELLNIYRDKRNELSRSQEDQKETNLQAKYDIIEAIKELVNSQESLNKTFQDFRNLQERWREIGPVPQKNVKDLWESYHYHVEAFYDFIKINKELRDLDFKKNLDAKIALCEKAEELLLEPSVVEAFRKLQLLHDQWREIGPVPSDKRTEIWDRFRDATSKINHRHQEYFVTLKDEQKSNLHEKTALCEKAEALAAIEIDSAKDWEEKSKELIELQKIWKSIGFAPKKYNTKVYERFRAACDSFFDKKREYFAQNREEQENNLQLKTELCIQAEALQNSTDWKKTTDELIRLQKRWKTIGPVPVKVSDKIWKRFRAACDTFFNNKSKFFENIDSTYEENLKQKEELIKAIENFELSANENQNLEQLKEFQRQWSEIGFVPIKQKESIQEKYREIINKKFDQLKVDDEEKSILKFRNRVEGIASKPNSDRRLSVERDKLYTKLKQLENDITLWENNIGFFANSKNAKSMINDVEQKIEAAKVRIELIKEKINIIDDIE